MVTPRHTDEIAIRNSATARDLLRPLKLKTCSRKKANSTVSNGVAKPMTATTTRRPAMNPNEMRVGWLIN